MNEINTLLQELRDKIVEIEKISSAYDEFLGAIIKQRDCGIDFDTEMMSKMYNKYKSKLDTLSEEEFYIKKRISELVK